jgi:hypothetical protein
MRSGTTKQLAGYQRLLLDEAQIHRIVPALVADLENVATALRGQQGGSCAAALDQGIGR